MLEELKNKSKTASCELIREVAAQWFSARPSSGAHMPLACRTTVTVFFPSGVPVFAHLG